MKKLMSLFLAMLMIVSLAACAGTPATQGGSNTPVDTASPEDPATPEDTAPETVTIQTTNANSELIDLEIPYDPQRLAVMDLAVLDMLDNFGLGDRIVGVSKGSSIDYLQDYVSNDAILNLGTIKEADLEAVMECEPDVIFIGGRLRAQYDELSKIAPVVLVATDSTIGVIASTGKNALSVASLFGKEAVVSDLLAEYDARIATLAAGAEGKTAVVGMINAGGFAVLGNDARCSIIGVEVGYENIGVDADIDTSTHGNEASFEFLVDKNPDYIFIMDRDAAIGTEGAKLAPEVMDNELVAMTSAQQNGNIVYLEHSNVWYTAEGGITALDIMLSDLESSLS